ncbi:MAG: metalloregulator ArsR/SmtB family transcription factor [bacterium]
MSSKCCCTNENAKCDCAIIHKTEVDNTKENMLNEEKISKVVSLHKVLADQTRMKILLALSIEQLCVCDIANVLDMTKSAVSHQLKVLRENNLIKFTKSGKNCYYSLTDSNVNKIIDITIEYIEG